MRRARVGQGTSISIVMGRSSLINAGRGHPQPLHEVVEGSQSAELNEAPLQPLLEGPGVAL